MPRKPRIWYPGALYHITSRGNRKFALFYDDYDREKYLDILEETRTHYPFHLHAYCLMTNHIHLQLETIDHHTSNIMKMLHSRYAIYFNKRYDFVGHVFQGRYKADIIKSINSYLKVSRYIHLNPVEANIVKHAEKYPWSSYAAYVLNIPNRHITKEKTYNFFPGNKETQQKAYQKYVEEPEEDETL